MIRRKTLAVIVMLTILFPWLAMSVGQNLGNVKTSSSGMPQVFGSPPSEESPTVAPVPGSISPGAYTFWQVLIVAIVGSIAVIAYFNRKKTFGYEGSILFELLGMALALGIFYVEIALAKEILVASNSPPSGSFVLSVQTAEYIAIASVLAATAVGLIFLSRGRDTVVEPLQGAIASNRDREKFVTVLKSAARSLRGGGDYRMTIIECYRALCEALENHGVANGPAMTAREFERASLALLSIKSERLHKITLLFEKARYSAEEITEQEVQESRTEFESLESEIEGGLAHL
jgi:hypothetical protein